MTLPAHRLLAFAVQHFLVLVLELLPALAADHQLQLLEPLRFCHPSYHYLIYELAYCLTYHVSEYMYRLFFFL